MTLYYVVKVGSEWAVLEMGSDDMVKRLKDKPDLLANLVVLFVLIGLRVFGSPVK